MKKIKYIIVLLFLLSVLLGGCTKNKTSNIIKTSNYNQIQIKNIANDIKIISDIGKWDRTIVIENKTNKSIKLLNAKIIFPEPLNTKLTFVNVTFNTGNFFIPTMVYKNNNNVVVILKNRGFGKKLVLKKYEKLTISFNSNGTKYKINKSNFELISIQKIK